MQVEAVLLRSLGFNYRYKYLKQLYGHGISIRRYLTLHCIVICCIFVSDSHISWCCTAKPEHPHYHPHAKMKIIMKQVATIHQRQRDLTFQRVSTCNTVLLMCHSNAQSPGHMTSGPASAAMQTSYIPGVLS